MRYAELLDALSRCRERGDIKAADKLLSDYAKQTGVTADKYWHLNVMIEISTDLGDAIQAEAYARRLVKLDPSDGHARLRLAGALIEAGRPNEALVEIQNISTDSMTRNDAFVIGTFRALALYRLGALATAINGALTGLGTCGVLDVSDSALAQRKLLLGLMYVAAGKAPVGAPLVGEALGVLLAEPLGNVTVARWLVSWARASSAVLPNVADGRERDGNVE